MKIKCKYDNDDNAYKCKVQIQNIPPDTKLEFIGEHKDGKTDNDVRFVYFDSCIVSKVPQGLTEKFPNLEGLRITISGLKDINRTDLLEYKNFKWLFFGLNNIKYLPGDLFADCKTLETISFVGNPLTCVEPNILDGLENLKFVNFHSKNIKYGYIDSKSTIAFDNPKLVQMKLELCEKYMKSANVKELIRFKTFFQTDEALKDFCIIIGDKQFLVHKTFLAARSPTLAEILRNNRQAENLNLADISVDIFEAILKFLYADKFPKKVDFMQLFAAAGRLKIEELKKYASEKILEQLDHENAPEVLSLGNKYKHDIMKREAFEKIKQKYPKIDFKEEWLNKDEKVKKMLERLQKIQKIEKELVDSMECKD